MFVNVCKKTQYTPMHRHHRLIETPGEWQRDWGPQHILRREKYGGYCSKPRDTAQEIKERGLQTGGLKLEFSQEMCFCLASKVLYKKIKALWKTQ